MFKQTSRKIFIGLVAGALFSAGAPVMAETDTGVLIDSSGKAVMTSYGECVKAPNQPAENIPAECLPAKPEAKPEPEAKPDQPKPVKRELIGTIGDNLVNFAFDKAVVTAEGKKVLDNIASYLKTNDGFVEIVEVQGHTDSVGADAYNMKLGQRRADAVANYLISQGVNKAKIKAVSYGETKPVDTNKTKAGRAKNRRAEVHITIVK